MVKKATKKMKLEPIHFKILVIIFAIIFVGYLIKTYIIDKMNNDKNVQSTSSDSRENIK
jgi:hypothetical protein